MNNNLTYSPVEHQHLQQSINALTKKVDDGIKKLTNIESYLYNDEKTGNIGVVKQVKQNTEHIEKLQQSERKNTTFLKWLAIIAGAVGTFVFEFLKWLFNNHKP